MHQDGVESCGPRLPSSCLCMARTSPFSKCTTVTAFVQGDDLVDRARFGKQAQLAAPAPVGETAPPQRCAPQNAGVPRSRSSSRGPALSAHTSHGGFALQPRCRLHQLLQARALQIFDLTQLHMADVFPRAFQQARRII